MNTNNFKIGDFVLCFPQDKPHLQGKIGKIVDTIGSNLVGIEFLDPINLGHNCMGKGKADHCSYILTQDLLTKLYSRKEKY